MTRAATLLALALTATGCMHDVKVGYLEAAEINVASDIQTVLVINRASAKNTGEHVLAGMEGKVELVIPKGNQPFGPHIWVVGLAPGMVYPIKIGRGDFKSFTAGAGGIVELRNSLNAKRAEIVYDEKIRLQFREGRPAPTGPAPTLGGSR